MGYLNNRISFGLKGALGIGTSG